MKLRQSDIFIERGEYAEVIDVVLGFEMTECLQRPEIGHFHQFPFVTVNLAGVILNPAECFLGFKYFDEHNICVSLYPYYGAAL
ncbi:hypothetical protein GCM10007352_18600 [Mucilaginibacter phyllosphaerae]|nr:hypothetical protein GCM10007352_18600 [Mucilaginibacter phyllosphaerae]